MFQFTCSLHLATAPLLAPLKEPNMRMKAPRDTKALYVIDAVKPPDPGPKEHGTLEGTDPAQVVHHPGAIVVVAVDGDDSHGVHQAGDHHAHAQVRRIYSVQKHKTANEKLSLIVNILLFLKCQFYLLSKPRMIW